MSPVSPIEPGPLPDPAPAEPKSWVERAARYHSSEHPLAAPLGGRAPAAAPHRPTA